MHALLHTFWPPYFDRSCVIICVQNRPKLRVVDPLDYEGELVTRRKDLEHEKYLNLLLFPQQDITVGVVTRLISVVM